MWRLGDHYLFQVDENGDCHHQDFLLAEHYYRLSGDETDARDQMEEDGQSSNSREDFFFHEIEPEGSFN